MINLSWALKKQKSLYFQRIMCEFIGILYVNNKGTMKTRIAYILLIIIVGAFSNISNADTLILKNGERLEGITESVHSDSEKILIRMGSGTILISKDKIFEIKEEPESVGHLKIGRQLLDRKNYQAALEEFEWALELDPSLEEAQKGKALAEAYIEQVRETAEKERREQVANVLTEVAAANNQEQYERAIDLLTRAQNLDPPQSQRSLIRKLMIESLTGLGLQQLDRFNEYGAMESFKKVLELDPDNEIAREHLIKIWERDPSRLEEVIEAYVNKIENNPAEKETIFKLANALFNTQKLDEALSYYEKLVGDETVNREFVLERIRQILTTLHTRAAQNTNYEAAKNYYSRLLEFFPNMDNSTLYIYEYGKRKKGVAIDDVEKHLELAAYCKEHGIHEFAQREYELVLSVDPRNETAIEGLSSYAEEMYQEALFFFNNGQYSLASKTAQDILDKYPRVAGVIEKTSDLIERTNNELRRMMRQKEAEAKDLAIVGKEYFQRAEEYINLYMSAERKDNVRIISEKEEAKKYLRRAIRAWEKALELDPSLAALSSEDLNNRLADARSRLSVLESPVPMKWPLPRRIR